MTVRCFCLLFSSFVLLTVEASAESQKTVDGQIARALLKQEHRGENLLQDKSWYPFGLGFERVGNLIVCDNKKSGNQQRGIGQTVLLNQKQPELIFASLESKAEQVGGTIDANYSLYIDLTFTDNTHLYGQTKPFDVGSHNWQTRKLMIVPPKPVKSLSCYGMFRNHSGKAWFRNPKMTSRPIPPGWHHLDHTDFVLQGKAGEGYQVRDMTQNGPFVHIRKEALDLKLTVTRKDGPLATFYDLTLRDVSGRDRAITLAYSWPVQGDDYWWLEDPRRLHRVKPNSEYINAHPVPGAGNERLSHYPLAAVANKEQGVALGIDMDRPAFYRLIYHSGTKEMLLLFDLGLTPEKPSAKLRFCRFSFDPQHGFRAAVAHYYRLFPDAFRKRVTKQGNWMPFAKISEVQGWKDFGFAFKEGNNETSWDDANGITTFHYTEPMTWWMNMPPEMPRTYEAAIAEARRLAQTGLPQAKALFTSGFHDEQGKFAGTMRNEPWANGIVWSMNSMPGVQGDVTDFSSKWNPETIERLYGPEANGKLDGEYFDSSEGYATAWMDYRREHFSAAQTPLCFSSRSKRPGIFRAQIAFEYMREISNELHRKNLLSMANSTPSRICWFAPFLDVMGTETDWNRNNRWKPMSDADLLYRRVMCKGKPYCFLQNTNFENFSHQMVEKYMQRCLAYGMFPGFFSHNASEGHYFQTPELYQRDRPLFRKYLPLCQLVAEAGWEPLTNATSDNSHVYLERFGKRLLTVFNDSNQTQHATIKLSHPASGSARELVTGRSIRWENGITELTLPAEGVAVIELTRQSQ